MAVLQDKVALVTGASRGIGQAIAVELAKHGAFVICAATTEGGAAKTAARIREAGGTAEAVALNVTDTEAVGATIKDLAKSHGGLHILVNNAGITRDNLLVRMSQDDWNSVIDVNLSGTYNCIRAAARIMMKQRTGKIVNIASIVGQIGNPGQVNYSAAKAGIIGMTKSVAKELAPRNVQVNCVAPGFVETDMTSDLPDETKSQLLATIPAGRAGLPEEIAYAVAFLASPQADYMTGQVLNVDGGMVM